MLTISFHITDPQTVTKQLAANLQQIRSEMSRENVAQHQQTVYFKYTTQTIIPGPRWELQWRANLFSLSSLEWLRLIETFGTDPLFVKQMNRFYLHDYFAGPWERCTFDQRARVRTGSCVTVEICQLTEPFLWYFSAWTYWAYCDRNFSGSMAICSLAALILFLLSLATTGKAQSRYQQRILVLGGDGMLGSETVARLKLRGHDITILHRGTWYWDSALRIKPWVKFVQCDREDFDVCADKLGDITREKGIFDAVIDFSGYKPSHIKVNRGPLSFHFTISVCWLSRRDLGNTRAWAHVYNLK